MNNLKMQTKAGIITMFSLAFSVSPPSPINVSAGNLNHFNLGVDLNSQDCIRFYKHLCNCVCPGLQEKMGIFRQVKCFYEVEKYGRCRLAGQCVFILNQIWHISFSIKGDELVYFEHRAEPDHPSPCELCLCYYTLCQYHADLTSCNKMQTGGIRS